MASRQEPGKAAIVAALMRGVLSLSGWLRYLSWFGCFWPQQIVARRLFIDKGSN